MAKLLAALACAVALVLGLAYFLRDDPAPRTAGSATVELVPGGGTTDEAWRALLEVERRRVDALEAELAGLRAAFELALADARRPAAEGAPAPIAAEEERDARWYLEQYVRSFDRGGDGSEYFRLAVQAYAPELVDPIAALVRSGGTVAPLRVGLAGILGDARLAGSARAVEALLALLAEHEPEPLVAAAIGSLRAVADAGRVDGLVARVWRVPFAEQRAQLVRLVLDLVPHAPNAALAALMRTAPDEAAELELVALMRTHDVDGALEMFQLVSFRGRPTRIAGARRTHEFRDPRTLALVDEWAAREPDEEVRRILVGARESLASVPSWGAERATGPPDAPDPGRDSEEAWAPSRPDAGVEWLELGFARPARADELRVHEVCTAGGVARAILVDEAGGRHTVWEGTDPLTSPGVFTISFATTSYRVRAVRLEIDTRRRSGWDEIDAVELRGPDGAQWAATASASSTYGAGAAVALPFDLQPLLIGR